MVRLKVKEVAEAQGITDAAKLSRRTGISYDTARRLMNSDIDAGADGSSPRLSILEQVAKALDVKVTDLIDEDRTPVASSDAWTALTMQRAAS